MHGQDNQRVRLTKRLIKEALLRLLEQKSIEKINVTELCREAEINRATFYNHYGSQYDVLDEMKQSMIDDMQTLLEEADDCELSYPSRKRLEGICCYLKENAKAAKLFLENGNMDLEFAKKMILLSRQQEFTTKHLYAGYDEESKSLLFTFIVSGIFFLVRKWLLEDISKPPREIADMAYGLVMQTMNLHPDMNP